MQGYPRRTWVRISLAPPKGNLKEVSKKLTFFLKKLLKINIKLRWCEYNCFDFIEIKYKKLNQLIMYNWPQRKNQRLKDFDYSKNWCYFVTICTKNRENFFWEIIDWKIILNDYWKIAENVFINLSNHYKNCIIDEYIFMPNHFHGIVVIDNAIVGTGFKPVRDMWKNELIGTGLKPVPTGINKNHWISEIIRWFKTFSSRNINNFQKDFIFSWQRSFFDVIIKNDEQLNKIRQYIIDNPLKWELDVNNKKNDELVKKLIKEKIDGII